MAKASRSKSGRRFRAGGGRVTLKPCSDRPEGAYCAPLNHITTVDGEYWTCSCGRRYSAKAQREFNEVNPDWRSDSGSDLES